jgi:hypothetical protein
VFLVGGLFFEVFQRSHQKESSRFEAVAPEVVTQVVQNDILNEKQDVASQVMTASRTKKLTADEESLRLVEVAPESMVRFEDTGTKSEEEYDLPYLIEASKDQIPDMMESVEVAEESFLRVAHNGFGSVEDYVYSHVIEVYQDQFVDDAVFVGYVQDAFIQ